MFQLTVFALIFAGIYLMLGGLYLLAFGQQIRRGRRINRRLALLQDGRDSEEVLAILRHERDGAEGAERAPIVGKLAEMARHANVAISPRALWLLLVLMMAVAFFLLALFTNASPIVRFCAGRCDRLCGALFLAAQQIAPARRAVWRSSCRTRST